MIFKFHEFLAEAKKDKKSIVDLLTDLLTKKPSVKVGDVSHKGIYPQSAIINFFKENGMTLQNATDAMYAYNNDRSFKGKMKHVQVKNFKTKSNYPYYYMDLTEAEVSKLKEEIENANKEKAAPEIAKREEVKKKAAAAAKEKKERKTSTRKKPAAKK